MRKKMLISMVAVFLSVGLTGCGKPAHNFATEWSKNASEHWYACLDSDCTEKKDVGAHTFVEDATKGIAATCTATGKKVEVCSVCAYEKETTLPKTDHNYVAYPAGSRAATHDVDGVTAEKCSICGNVKETPIPALGHNFVVGATVKNVDNYDVIKHSCTCGKVALKMAVLDYSFLTEGSNSFRDGTIGEGDAAEAGEGVRVAGGGSIKWRLPIEVAGRYRFSLGANPAPNAIGDPNIETKNGVKVNGVEVPLIPSGPYSGLGIQLGQFNQLVMAEFDAQVTAPGEDLEIEITQVASQRLFWGGELWLTQIPTAE